MNLLQQFLDEANNQTRTSLINVEAFTFADDHSGPGGTPITYYGTFGDPVMMPIMTRQGFQDYLITPIKAQASQWTVAPGAENHKKLVRTQTGRTFYVQSIDYTAVVVYTFIATDRTL